jgi:hypothetical protein
MYLKDGDIAETGNSKNRIRKTDRRQLCEVSKGVSRQSGDSYMRCTTELWKYCLNRNERAETCGLPYSECVCEDVFQGELAPKNTKEYQRAQITRRIRNRGLDVSFINTRAPLVMTSTYLSEAASEPQSQH